VTDWPIVDMTAAVAFLFFGAYVARLVRETIGDIIALARLVKRIKVVITWRNEP
jgi:hypothetical protein